MTHHKTPHRVYGQSTSIIYSVMLLCFMISCFGGLSGCSDALEVEQNILDKSSYHERSYYDDPYADPYGETSENPWGMHHDDEAVIEQLLAQDLGYLEPEDLTDGSTVVAGPGYGPSVVLSCQEGALYVIAGAATGVLATVFAASGVVAAGGGVAATAPASVPMYAAAGGLIGLGASSASWGRCITPLARVALGLIQNGYLSAARGIQELVFQMRRGSDAQSQSQSQSVTDECRGKGRKCNDMTGRYKNNFCDPLNEWRDWLHVDVHEAGICDLGGLSCADIAEIAQLAAGCWRGRQAVTQRCFGGRADPGHQRATDYGERDFFSCVDLSFEMGCNDYSIEDRLDQQAQDAYPECL